ncbi:tartrate transporter [Fusarium phyllophilum]|uniref:Tartrate transporter n=1 Tax=Fusarium phyllophilum TaxID=47803 RepID=A0A8H5NJC7_9HYPO|nr:tartrate transporter [Fusarium phyllophilum]
MAAQHPSFEELPLDKTGPRGNAWGLWGKDDQLGTMNHLADEIVGQAARENIKTRTRLSLNWSMKGASYPKFARKNLDLKLINKAPLKHAHDDEVGFPDPHLTSKADRDVTVELQLAVQFTVGWIPTLCLPKRSSQLYYMGRKAEEFAASDHPNSIHYVSAKGIAGRAVFIDWYSWALAQGLEIDAMSSYEIPFDQIVKTLEFQNMGLDSLRAGDIIVIRFGYLSQYENMDVAKREYLDNLYQTQKPDNIGLKPSEELLRFFWNTKIAAICGDARSLEVWPCSDKFVEHAPDAYPGLSPEDAEFMRGYEGKTGKKVVKKIDFRLLPIMAVLYLLAHIDRGNIGNAKIEGMDKDLGLVGNQYNIASTIFFVPYIIFEVPSNIVLKKNFQGLVACRVILGVFEAGFFPGAVFIVSSWYPRHELQQRLAIFYTASAFSGALSGLLAFGIARLDGARGIAGWRWIFLIEGAWLSDDEKRFVDLRLRLSGERSNTEEGDKFSWKLLFKTMVDWKVLLGIILAWANSVPNAAFKFTMPQIIKQLGFSTAQSQLLTMPPYVCGGIAAWLTGRFSDRLSWRMPFIVGPMSVLLVALAVLFNYSKNVADNVPAMYVGVMLAQIGIYPLLPGISAWTGNNLAPSWKRSIGLAWLLAAGNLGSLVGTNIFLDREGPQYPTGYGVSLGIICLAAAWALLMEFCLWKSNKARAQLSEAEIRQKYSQEELDAMGERNPLYKYTL